MSDESGELRVAFNGEIYNFRDLREQLQKLGHAFRGRSDTEVLLHGYESWGHDLFAKLRGMFAFALWDNRARRLILARDRLGKKPFFYSIQNDRFIFGSELPVFRQVPELSLTISPASFSEYVEFGYVQSPSTILNEVRQLPPGHFATWDRSGFQTQAFWKLPDAPRARKECDLSTTAKLLEQSFRDAVACRLISDVPLGCFLSGGIDSSLVAAHARELVSDRLQTFTVGFENSPMNEASYAREIAQHLQTDHHEITVDPNSILDEFEQIFARVSEPIGDDSFLPTYVISRETKREVTVALSGDGGDEVFAGYDKYRRFDAARKLRRVMPAAAARAALAVSGHYGGDNLTKSLEAVATPDEESLARWLSTLWKSSEVKELLLPEIRAAQNADGFFSATWKRKRNFSEVERFMLVDMETYLIADILTKVDRASMAHGLEVRCPFLDHEFLTTALQVSERARPGKMLLKEMLAQKLPRRLFERPKAGFGMPISDWYRGRLRGVLEKYTAPQRIRRRNLLSADTLQRFVQLHLSGRRDFGRKLHAIVAFEIWADQFFGEGATLA